MREFIDLHVHSTFSDGTLTPEKLIQAADEIKLAAIALTDHDTVAGIGDFLREAKLHPELEAIAGVELSTRFGAREMHIVGLFLDPESVELNAFLSAAREERMLRNEAIKAKLASLNYPVSWDEIAPDRRDCASVGRPHFAAALMKKFQFPDKQSVFDKLLKNGAPAYVPRKLPEPAAAIAAIHGAGGIAVWAHPVYRNRNERAWARRVMKRFAGLGLDAVEGYYSMFSATETAMITELAALNHLALSGGSDYHGKNSPQIELGVGAGGLRVPVALLDALKAKRPAVC